MRNFIMRKRFDIAIEKSQDVLNKLAYEGQDMVDTNKVKDIVEEITGTKIKVGYIRFSDIDKEICNCGAMIRVDKDTNEAFILLNIEKDALFRRFSLVHELGHLITGAFAAENDKYTVSAHIHYKITEISDAECERDVVVENEQMANIFALSVLMPGEHFSKKALSSDSLTELADFYGVHKEAVLSRMRLEAC